MYSPVWLERKHSTIWHIALHSTIWHIALRDQICSLRPRSNFKFFKDQKIVHFQLPIKSQKLFNSLQSDHSSWTPPNT